jgi:hypothetical protein
MLNSEGINWHHKISDTIDMVSHKPKSSQPDLTFMEPCIANAFLSANEMQRYTMFFIVVSALHVSSGLSAHDQELKNCTCSIGTCQTAICNTINY